MSNNLHHGRHYRGYLPHIDLPAKHYAITYRLADALPSEVLVRLDHEFDADDLRRERIDALMAAGSGACVLKNAENAQTVVDVWRFHAGVRYLIDAWVVMPNHVHLVIKLCGGAPLEDVVRSWKSFSARAINRRLGSAGRVWQADYWDRLIRNEDHYFAAIRYVHENPVRAGLVSVARDWRWSTAREWEERRNAEIR
ncbi:MAG: transposase [Planctomycetes bacterium]|nr:transposase [Planctomycetota bacterium]